MKQVKLYTLKETIENVWSDDEIKFFNHREESPKVVRNASPSEFVMQSVEVITAPIEKYVYNTAYDTHEVYVAFDPRVRKLLGVDALKADKILAEEKCSQADIRNMELACEINDRDFKMLNLKNTIWAMTFWQRLVFCLFKKLPQEVSH